MSLKGAQNRSVEDAPEPNVDTNVDAAGTNARATVAGRGFLVEPRLEGAVVSCGRALDNRSLWSRLRQTSAR